VSLLATALLLARAELTRGASGARPWQGARSRHQLWPDPARIPRAGRRYERLARWTALTAAAALAVLAVARAAR
jgi:hypothetical protein